LPKPGQIILSELKNFLAGKLLPPPKFKFTKVFDGDREYADQWPTGELVSNNLK